MKLFVTSTLLAAVLSHGDLTEPYSFSSIGNVGNIVDDDLSDQVALSFTSKGYVGNQGVSDSKSEPISFSSAGLVGHFHPEQNDESLQNTPLSFTSEPWTGNQSPDSWVLNPMLSSITDLLTEEADSENRGRDATMIIVTAIIVAFICGLCFCVQRLLACCCKSKKKKQVTTIEMGKNDKANNL